MYKIAIITTHPIQYNVPLFRKMSQSSEIEIKVFYTWEKWLLQKYDDGFGKNIEWDIPLAEGYNYTFVKNISGKQDTSHFFRMITPSLNKEITEWGANAILIYGWRFYSHLNAIRYFKGKIPVFFRGDSTLLNEKKGIKSLLRRKILKLVYRNIDFAFYVGQNNKDYFFKHGLNEKQLIFAPHSIDEKHFEDTKKIYRQNANILRKNMNISAQDIVILFAGKFQKIKNPEIILKAADLLNKNYKAENHLHFLFVGNGELENILKFRAENIANIHFLPFQNQTQMPIIYRIADIFVLPSKSETWGLSINEAMACGVAILASNKVGSGIDLVKDTVNGYIFDSENFDDFFRKISLLVKNKSHLIEMGRNSVEIIKKYSVDITSQNIIDSFMNILSL